MLGMWLRLFGFSCGTATAVVAAQLGAAQAMGIISWEDVGTAESWRTTLTWVAFSYLVAVLGGATIGRALTHRRGRGRAAMTAASRLGAAFGAAVGAGAATLLAWLPAHSARPPVSVHPELVVALTAGAGIAAGLVLAVAALYIAPVARALEATTLYVWLLVTACVVTAVAEQSAYSAPRLGVPDAPSVLPQAWWSGPYMIVGAAVLLGAVIALITRWRGASRGGVAISGLAGPAAIAVSYVIPGLDLTGDGLAPVAAMGAGLLTSIVVALPPRRRRRTNAASRPTRPASAAPEAAQPNEGDLPADSVAAAPLAMSAASATPTWPAWNGPTSPNAATREANPLPTRPPITTPTPAIPAFAPTPQVPTQRTGRGQTYGSGAVYGADDSGAVYGAESSGTAHGAESSGTVYGTATVQPAVSAIQSPLEPPAQPKHAAPTAAIDQAALGAVMGRPPRSADEEFSGWLHDRGSTPPSG